jgi:hypothetical protein
MVASNRKLNEGELVSERKHTMIRKLALVVAVGMAVPAAALACDVHQQQQAKTDEANSQALLVAQADTTPKTPSKKSGKKSKTPKKRTPKNDMPK